eukprot:8066948-Pyramimonas_sp.AAC.1
MGLTAGSAPPGTNRIILSFVGNGPAISISPPPASPLGLGPGGVSRSLLTVGQRAGGLVPASPWRRGSAWLCSGRASCRCAGRRLRSG